MKKFYQIDEFFPAAGDQRFSLTAESPLDQVEYNVFSADDFADAALYEYGERVCLFPETKTPLALFYSRFARWKAQRGKDIAAAFSVLRTEYNPLQNYDSVETKSGTDTGLKTPANWKQTTEHKVSLDYKEIDTQKPNQWKESLEHKVSQDYKETESQKPNQWKESTEHSVSEDFKKVDSEKPNQWSKTTQGLEAENESTTLNRVAPFNNSDLLTASGTGVKTKNKQTETQTGSFDHEHTQEGTEKDETTTSGQFDVERTQAGSRFEDKTITGSFANEHTQEGSKSEEVTQTGTFEDKMTYNTTISKSGNIGVTTSQQMAQSEIDLRAKQFVRDVIREFFDLVSVYI